MAAPPVTVSGPIGVQRRGHRTAAFFDLDKTIIAKSSTLAFSRPFQAGGLISRRAVLRTSNWRPHNRRATALAAAA